MSIHKWKPTEIVNNFNFFFLRENLALKFDLLSKDYFALSVHPAPTLSSLQTYLKGKQLRGFLCKDTSHKVLLQAHRMRSETKLSLFTSLPNSG